MAETSDCPMLSRLLELVKSKLCSLNEEEERVQQELKNLECIVAVKKSELEELTERKLSLESQMRDFKNACDEEWKNSSARQKEMKKLLQETPVIKSNVQYLKQLKSLVQEASLQEENSRLRGQEASSSKTQVEDAYGTAKEEYCKAFIQYEFFMGEKFSKLQYHWTEAQETFQILEDSCKRLIENSAFI